VGRWRGDAMSGISVQFRMGMEVKDGTVYLKFYCLYYFPFSQADEISPPQAVGPGSPITTSCWPRQPNHGEQLAFELVPGPGQRPLCSRRRSNKEAK
jgi:hypothetical protein